MYASHCSHDKETQPKFVPMFIKWQKLKLFRCSFYWLITIITQVSRNDMIARWQKRPQCYFCCVFQTPRYLLLTTNKHKNITRNRQQVTSKQHIALSRESGACPSSEEQWDSSALSAEKTQPQRLPLQAVNSTNTYGSTFSLMTMIT